MKIHTIPVGAFQENSYLLADEPSGSAVLVDPGDEPERLLDVARRAGVEIEAVWLTHAHVDHVGAVAAVKRAVNVPVYLHPLDEPLYRSAVQHGLAFGLRVEEPPPPDRQLAEGDELRVGSLKFDVLHTPGHSPGHVVIHGHGVAFVGDCLFAGSVGRTDLPLSNGGDLARSLLRIAALPDDTVAYPGHGPATSIGQERATNPFLNGALRIPGS